MEFEDIEIGLLNEHASVPDKAELLTRFQNGLAERLRGEPDVHAVDSSDDSTEEITTDEGDASNGPAESLEPNVESEDSANIEGEDMSPVGPDDEGENEQTTDSATEAESVDAGEEDYTDEEPVGGKDEVAQEEDSEDSHDVITEESLEEDESVGTEASENDELDEEDPKKDYSDEWTPEELAELGEDA